METGEQSKIVIRGIRQKMSDILVAVSWRDIARTYFGTSSSRLYHKLDGIDGNGGTGDFPSGGSTAQRGVAESFGAY